MSIFGKEFRIGQQVNYRRISDGGLYRAKIVKISRERSFLGLLLFGSVYDLEIIGRLQIREEIEECISAEAMRVLRITPFPREVYRIPRSQLSKLVEDFNRLTPG
jgi:hypothetical protein